MSSASSAALAALTLTFCFTGAPHSACGQAGLPTPNVVFISSPNPSEVEELVTFTATVSSPDNGATPQGSITISEYPPGQPPIIYGTAALTNGVGQVTTAKLTEGTHVIFATYGGEPGVYNGAQSQLTQVVNQVSNPVSAEPLHTVIPVHLDAGNGNISLGCVGSLTAGCKVYPGANPGMHMLAFSRQPDLGHLDQPDVIQDGTFRDASSANQFLANILTDDPEAFLIVNAAGNYGFALNAIAKNLEKFGAWSDIEAVTGPAPFVFFGNGGRNPGQALQRGYSTLNVDGYLAADSNTKYAFIQTDYVPYDITTDGTIKVGAKTYTMASSYNPGACDRSNAFHLVVVNREAPDVLIANNSYCTAQYDAAIAGFIQDLRGVLGHEEQFVFIASNGHPIPANWNFGTDGDARIYPLAEEIARLGGYFETMVYLTPKDTYSLVGASAPPIGTPGAANRARESSSVYPDHPTGELHGVLARGRGNWYTPLDADPTGQANLGLYKILAQAPVPFPLLANKGQLDAFQYISNQLCDSTDCNVRNQYSSSSSKITLYIIALSAMSDPSTNTPCPDKNPSSAFCIVRSQLLTELRYVANIHALNDNLNDLWATSGTVTIFSLLNVSNTIIATLKPPPQASVPNLVEPIVSFFLGLASELPVVGRVAGIADTAFNFATSLTTDPEGNEAVSLTSTVAQVAKQAGEQFTAQGTTTGTQFDFIYQDWGKIQALGTVLAQAQPGSPWYWDASATGKILQAMSPAIEESYYKSLMAGVYAVGSYYPYCNLCIAPGNGWGTKPIYLQPRSYTVNDPDGPYSPGSAHKANPFYIGIRYFSYTFPTDSDNPYNDPSNPKYTVTNTLLTDNSWLGISLHASPSNSGSYGLYDPPDETVLSHLFTPLSKGGLGVYRPAFFESWPFPRITCGWSDNGSGNPGPGCDWGAAAPSPDAVPGPVTSVSIGTGASKELFAGKGQIQVPLNIINNGTLELQSIQIDNVSLRTLAGSGEAMLTDPLLPIKRGNLAPGNSAALNLIITVPPGIEKLAVAEEVTVSNGKVAPPSHFVFGQVVFPHKQQ